MARLKSRQKFIPGGFVFFQPETGWKSQPNASFETIVGNLIAHRNANPFLRDKHRWATDVDQVRDEVDQFNARVCQQMGWNDYVQASAGGGAPAFFPQPSQSDQRHLAAVADKVRTIWAGVRTLNDWLDSGTDPVPAEQSAARAVVCSTCPKNGSGDFTKWFTRPAAEAIRVQLEKVSQRKLSTPSDSSLNICEVCLCPMKLKVHTPLSFVNAHLSDEILKNLEEVKPECWIITERKA